LSGATSGGLEPFALGSLVASYIGGAANFFETCSFSPLGTDTSIFASVAAVDIGVMCAYFASLLGLRRWKGKSASLRAGEGEGDDGMDKSILEGQRERGQDSFVVRVARPVAISVCSAALVGVLQSFVGILGLSVTLSTGLAVVLWRILSPCPSLPACCPPPGGLPPVAWRSSTPALA